MPGVSVENGQNVFGTSLKIVLILFGIIHLHGLTGASRQSIQFYLEPYIAGDKNFCPKNTTFPTFSLSGVKIPEFKILENLVDFNGGQLEQVLTTGIFAFYSGVNYTISTTAVSGPGVCTAYKNGSQGSSNSARYLGNPDFDLPGLSLFPGQDGLVAEPLGEETYIGENVSQLRFNGSKTVAFYALTGPASWTLYTGPDFDGDSTCLRPLSSSFLYNYGRLAFLRIASVRQGCFV